MTIKATVMQKGLTATGLSDAEALDIIKAKIAKGEVENDLPAGSVQTHGGVPQSVIDAAAAALAKANGVESDIKKGGKKTAPQEPEEDDEEDDESEDDEEEDDEDEGMGKGGQFDDEAINAIVGGADRIVKGVTRQNKSLLTVLSADIALGTAIAKGMNEQNERIADLTTRMDALLKAVNVSVPPRSVTGNAEPAPAPSEQSADGKTINKGGLVDPELVRAKINKGLQAAPNSERRHELAAAASELESGVSAKLVAERYHIELA